MGTKKWWWWVRQIGLIGIGGFYLYFGIQMLIGAYILNNPLTFIFTFFASNLIILISAVLIAGFIYRLVVVMRLLKSKPSSQNDPNDSPGNGQP